MKRPLFLPLILLILLICTYSVWTQQKERKDLFYTDHGGDAMRIPLIKPYAMLKLNQQLEINQRLGWSIYLHVSPSEKELYYYNAIHDVEKIAVQNGVVMAYTTYVQEIDKDAGQKVLHWFVIVPDRKVETGFDTEAEFLNSIQAYGIQQPNWLEPDTLYKQFTEAGCLEWMPDCK